MHVKSPWVDPAEGTFVSADLSMQLPIYLVRLGCWLLCGLFGGWLVISDYYPEPSGWPAAGTWKGSSAYLPIYP